MAIDSAITTENQIPSKPNNNGTHKTDKLSKTKVLRKEIKADVKPSFKAVKKPDTKMEVPENKKESP